MGDEDEFARMLIKRAEDGGKIKVVDVAKKESEIEAKEIITLAKVVEGVQEKFPGFQLGASFEGLVETVPGVNLELLRMDKYELDPSKDTLFRGEFEVVRELIEALPEAAAAKRECDKVIDKNGPPPLGTGIKQLRENIAESKLSYEIMDDAAQAFLKTKIMDNIHKYFYLICFTGYLRDQGKVAKDGITDEDKKAFALTGGKVSTPTESLKLAQTFVAL